MDEWDNKNNGTGPDAEQTDSANDTHIENNADQMPPYTQQAPYQSSFGAGGYYQQGGPSEQFTSKGSSPINRPTNITKRRQAVGGRMAAAHKKRRRKPG